MNFPLTPEQLDAKRHVLLQNGIRIDGNSGSVSSHGCVIDYSYDGATLALILRSHPWYLPAETVEAKLAAFFQ